jgi:hypothetical protein
MSKRRTEREADLGADSFPPRWVELGSADPSSSPENDIERRIGSLLEKVPPPPALGRAAHDRVQTRLRESRRPERPLAPSWIGRLAMGSGLGAFSFVVGGAVVAAAGVGAWWKISQTRAPSPPVVMMARDQIRRNVPRHHPHPRAVARADGPGASGQVTPESAPEPVPPLEAPPMEPSSDVAMGASPPRPRARASAPSRAAAHAPGSTELAQETGLLEGALAALRQQHDGAAALARLDEYLGRFPNGILVGEARRARIDALLLLGRRDDAQSALDRLDLEPVGRGQELMLIRGELRARHDCADAIADFDVVIGHAASPPLAERALFGRAACHQQEGERGAARADALAYLDRFPAGRFAGAARRLLAQEGSRPDRPSSPMSPEGGL